jgi:protein tyrosine phosphatase
MKFQNFPTGYLKDNTESLKKENNPKNQDQSILPCKSKVFCRHVIFCDFYLDDVNRVKLNNKKEHRSTDYINASYVQVSCIKRK